jgi:hypothetical protein
MTYELHAVIISKNIPLDEAIKISQEIINNKKRTFYRETKNSYRFRNIPKTKFDKKTFRSKKINKNITLIFGDVIS